MKLADSRYLNMSVDGDGDEQIFGYLPGSVEPYVSHLNLIFEKKTHTRIWHISICDSVEIPSDFSCCKNKRLMNSTQKNKQHNTQHITQNNGV